MALQINGTVDKPITILGTNVVLPSVYNRLEFAARIDGITIEIASFIYADETFFQNGQRIATNLENENIIATIDLGLGETQNLAAAEKYAKLAYESLGYQVVIIE